MCNNYSVEQWAQIISSSETSGLKRSEWLELNGITKDQYYYWRNQVKKMMSKGQMVTSSATTLVELPIASAPAKAEKRSEVLSPAVIRVGTLAIELSNDASSELIENIGRMIHNAL